MLVLAATTLAATSLYAEKKESTEVLGGSNNTAIITKNVTPEGWIHEFLERQESGLTGHPEESGFPFNTKMWSEKVKQRRGAQDWWAYEQTGYYLDGALRVGYLNKSKALLDRVNKNIDNVMKNSKPGKPIQIDGVKDPDWPLVIFIRMLLNDYENTGDAKILEFIESNYDLKYSDVDLDKLPTSGFRERNFLHIENLCLLSQLTGKKKYLDYAIKLYDYYDKKQARKPTSASGMLKGRVSRTHAVTQHNFMGLPAVLYYYTKNPYYLKAIKNGYKLLEKNSELVDGLSSGFEQIHADRKSNYVHETCNAIDFIWSCGWLSMATEDTHWADKIEKVFFNAGIGSLSADFKGHQYYSSPNQVILTDKSSLWNINVGWGKRAVARMTYRAGHDTECCTGNIHRMLPSYINWMWFVNKEAKTVTASLYGPGDVKFSFSDKKKISISEKTNYPFENNIDFVFAMDKPEAFTFKMRIPAWSQGYQVLLNGKVIQKDTKNGFYTEVKRTYKNGDKLTLKLDVQPIVKHTVNIMPRKKNQKQQETKEGIYVQYGSLVFSLPVAAKVTKETDLGDGKASEAFPAYEQRPAGQWAYALSKNLKSSDIKVIRKQKKGYPWDEHMSPITLQVKAREVLNWKVDGDYTTDWPKELKLGKSATLTLEPLGSTVLRVTEFPKGDF